MSKRLFDLIISIIGILILLPIFIITSLFIVTDGGPVIYKQVRVGFRGKEFSIFKFRSMVTDADKTGGYSTLPDDKRVTPVGKFIRKTSIDELPQLINVVMGQMSLVGPRPNVPAQCEEYTKEQWEKRNSVTPGITGVAQSRNRSNATWQERYNMDIEYVDNKSLFLDIKIIIDTFKQVLSKGSY